MTNQHPTQNPNGLALHGRAGRRPERVYLSKHDMHDIVAKFSHISVQMIRLSLNFKQNGLNARLIRNYALNFLPSATFVEA